MARSLDTVFHALLPKDKIFFPLFHNATQNLCETAGVFEKALQDDARNWIECLTQIDMLEKQGDEYTHAIMNAAASTFIVPFDREDIQQLTIAIDDVVDIIHACAKRMDIYKIYNVPESIIKLASITHKAAIELHNAVTALKSLRHSEEISKCLSAINEYENQADQIMNDAIAALFRDNTDPIEVIKLQEVISLIEVATDKCEDAANVIESVLIKFS
jgi:uncharacterized protein